MKILRFKKIGLFIFFLAVACIQSAIAQDFNFTIEPGSLTLVPGQSASFVVSVTPFGGFTNQVTLSATNLPSGVTASFSPVTVNSPGTSLLTLNATTNAANGAFTLELTATGGGISHTASGGVSVSFGLLPICYGAFQGTVTDTNTGLPVPNANILLNGYYYTTANSNGQYLLTNLNLSGAENLPAYYGIGATASGYWTSTTEGYAVCGATNTINLQILPQQTGIISGVLTNESGQPVTNVTVTAQSYPNYYSAITDSNGVFQLDSLQLQNDNSPAYYNVSLTPSGYWYINTNTIVHGNSNSVLDLLAIPVCYQTVIGSVVYASTGLPATNATITVNTLYNGNGEAVNLYANPDSSGNFTFTNVSLGLDNADRTAYVTATAPGYYSSSTNIALTNCLQAGAILGQPGGPATAGVLSLIPIPPPPVVTNNYGAVTGHVYDLQTGLIITNASVFIYYVDYTSTDTNGAYIMTNLLVGTGTVTNTTYYVEAQAPNYFTSASNVVVNANETNTQDLYLLRTGYGYIVGTVLNANTGLPVAGAYVGIGGGQTTGANGQYSSGPLALNTPNAPTFEGYYVQETGYWQLYTNTTVTNGITNVVNISFIPVCGGATVVGNVVNANTQQPITNATVSTYSQGGGGYYSAMTDSNGNFTLANITVGNDNAPSGITLTAAAPGFNQQTKSLTIFCDATISTEFGAPETVFGAIDGYVTNAVTGQPLTNVFIGSSFGGSTYTDTNGYYILNQAPLGANGSNRTWTVTAGASTVTVGTTQYPAQTKSVVVSANMTNLLDFGFGQALTELAVTNIGAPDTVDVGSNLLYTITLTNAAAVAANVVLADALPAGVTFVDASITNNPSGEFGAPVLSNGVVTITATNFSSNAVVVLLVTVTPQAAGALTNIATVTSDTPDINSTGTGRISIATNTAVAVVVPHAALLVTAIVTPNTPVGVGTNLIYTITLTNSAAAAANVVLTDTLPSGTSFVSASLANNPGETFSSPVTSGGVVTITAPSLASQSGVVLLITVTAQVSGMVTNSATVTTTTPDPGDTNHNAIVVSTVLGSEGGTASLSVVPGETITLNPQTGLFQQTVQVNNTGGAAATAVSLAVMGLPAKVTVYNATGTNNGTPYVVYNFSVPAGGNVVLLLEYYDPSRSLTSANSPTFAATVIAAVAVPQPTGTYVQLDSAPYMSEGELTIEFPSIPGHTYVVQYSSDMLTWNTATPPIVAVNTRTVWIDDGPPDTETPPGSPGQRFYRIVQTN